MADVGEVRPFLGAVAPARPGRDDDHAHRAEARQAGRVVTGTARDVERVDPLGPRGLSDGVCHPARHRDRTLTRDPAERGGKVTPDANGMDLLFLGVHTGDARVLADRREDLEELIVRNAREPSGFGAELRQLERDCAGLDERAHIDAARPGTQSAEFGRYPCNCDAKRHGLRGPRFPAGTSDRPYARSARTAGPDSFRA